MLFFECYLLTTYVTYCKLIIRLTMLMCLTPCSINKPSYEHDTVNLELRYQNYQYTVELQWLEH